MATLVVPVVTITGEPPFFSTLWNSYEPTLLAGATNASNGLLTTFGPELRGAVMLVVIVFAIRTMLRRTDPATLGFTLIRTIIVAALLQATNYNTYVTTFFMTTLPNKIASALGGVVGEGSVPDQFESLRGSVDHMTATLLAQAGILDIGDKIAIWAAGEVCTFMLLIGFLVFFISTALVAVVVPAGVVLLIAYLFDHTRAFAERWIGKMVAYMLLQLFVVILLTIVLTAYQTDMDAAEAAMGGGIDLDQAVNLLFTVAFDFGFGAILMLALPLIAAAIAGSHVSTVVVMPLRIAHTAVRAAASGGLR